ncbi:MAG: hypothetical protein ACNA7K_03960 [Acholeplasmataceae bacterium]
MKITSIVKKKTSYDVTFDSTVITLDPSVLLKYRLKVGDEIQPSQLKDITFDQAFVTYDHMALKKLKKMQTTYELKTFLEEKGAPSAVIKQLIDRYIKHKYLDDLNYAHTYVLLKSSSQGPNLMIDKLKSKGISHVIIDTVFKSYDESDVLKSLMIKKVQKTKGKSKSQLKTQLYTHFVSKGFTPEMIQSYMTKALEAYDVDEDHLIEKTLRVALHKYRQTHELYEAKTKALQKCIQKGFHYHDIKRVMDTLDDDL